MDDRDLSENEYDKYSEGLNYSFLLVGGGSFVLFLVAQINSIPILSFLAVTIFWSSIYFLPHLNNVRNKAKTQKITKEDRKPLIIYGIGIALVAILTFCYFVPDYKFYAENEKVIIGFYTLMIIFMLADYIIKIPKKIEKLRYRPGFKGKVVMTFLFLAVEFIILIYPTYAYIKIPPAYLLPALKVPHNITLKEIDSLKSKKNPLVIGDDDFQNHISQLISNKKNDDVSFLKGYRINLELLSKKYYEIDAFNTKDENGIYTNSLIVLEDQPLVIVTLQSNTKIIDGKHKYNNSQSVIELSDEEYKTIKDYIASSVK